jgi:phasin family protein
MPDSRIPTINGHTASLFPFMAFAFEHLALSQRRNAEFVTEVAKLTTGSVQNAWQKQWTHFSHFITEAQAGHRDLWSLGPNELVTKQAAVAKATAEKAVTGAREITDLFLKSSNQAADLVSQRIIESLTELQALPGKA